MRNTLFGAGVVTALIAGSAGTSAVAADLPVKAPPPVAAVWEWTGCYVGVSGGGTWGRTSNVDTTPPFVGLPVTNPFNVKGGIVGGTVGCNYQIRQWVIGIENDLSWTNARATVNEIPPFSTAATIGVKERWIDTLRGRLGYKVGAQNQLLLFVTGGVAWAGTTATTCLPGVFCNSVSNTRTGWAAGAGGEWALGRPVARNWWSVKLEYIHVDFGGKDYQFDPTLTTNKRFNLRNEIVRAGLNFHF